MKFSVLCLLNSCQCIISGTQGSSRAVCKICSISALPSPERTPGELKRKGGDTDFLQMYFQAPHTSLHMSGLHFFPFLLRGGKPASSSEFSLLALNLLSQKDARRWYLNANSGSQIPCLAIASMSQTLAPAEANLALPRRLPEMTRC